MGAAGRPDARRPGRRRDRRRRAVARRGARSPRASSSPAPSGRRAPLERSPADSCGRRPRRRTVRRCSTRSTPTAARRRRRLSQRARRDRSSVATTLADPSGTSIVSAGDRVRQRGRHRAQQLVPALRQRDRRRRLRPRAGQPCRPRVQPDPGHPNFPSAGRRPATTLHAWAVGGPDGAGVRLMGGTPGGANQMPWNAQTLARVLAGCERARRARHRAAVGVAARRRRCPDRGRHVRRRRRGAPGGRAARRSARRDGDARAPSRSCACRAPGEAGTAPPTRGLRAPRSACERVAVGRSHRPAEPQQRQGHEHADEHRRSQADRAVADDHAGQRADADLQRCGRRRAPTRCCRSVRPRARWRPGRSSSPCRRRGRRCST